MNTRRGRPGEATTFARSALHSPTSTATSSPGSVETPRFSKIARSYLLFVGSLDWTKINPDIFGSMIQAVADDEERGALGMHYTSVPNILKVLNPLFLDDLRAKLEEAGDGKTPAAPKLLNLRDRIARIRVFDPACGSRQLSRHCLQRNAGDRGDHQRRRGEPTAFPTSRSPTSAASSSATSPPRSPASR